MSSELATVPPSALDKESILRALNMDPRKPEVQGFVLVCQRYDLDPLLKHAVLISGSLYITRDGLLHVAHRSNVFDGMEVEQLPESGTHYVSKCSVWRRDMSRPFVFFGRYPRNGRMAAYGPEMADKVAACRALRHAFDVSLCSQEEMWEQGEGQEDRQPARPSAPAPQIRPAAPVLPAPEPVEDNRPNLLLAFAAEAERLGLKDQITNANGKRDKAMVTDFVCEVLDIDPDTVLTSEQIAEATQGLSGWKRRREEAETRAVVADTAFAEEDLSEPVADVAIPPLVTEASPAAPAAPAPPMTLRDAMAQFREEAARRGFTTSEPDRRALMTELYGSDQSHWPAFETVKDWQIACNLLSTSKIKKRQSNADNLL